MTNKEFIIGDNFDVLTSLKEQGRIYKVIYLDPPYNTKTKKTYNDTVNSNIWLTEIEKRISLCRDVLDENGLIFISIDDNEYAYVKVCCDNIFGRSNFIGTFVTMQAQRSNAKHINTVHEYVLCFAKNKKKVSNLSVLRRDIPEQNQIINDYINKSKLIDGLNDTKLRKLADEICAKYNISWLRNYSYIDNSGEIFFPVDMSTPGKPRTVDIPSIGLHLDPLPTRGWSSDNKFIEVFNAGRLVFRNGRPYSKHLLSESTDNVPSLLPFFSRQGTKDLKDLGIDGLFDTPKPVKMLKYLFRLVLEDGDSILDIYGGSGSSAQAIYELEEETHMELGFTLIQINENISDTKCEAYSSCILYDIKPNIVDIMLFRVNRYLDLKNKPKNYTVIGK